MKTLSERCESSKEISLSKATKILSKFVSADNGALQVVNAYLHRASAAFNELNQFHRELRPSQSHRKNCGSHTSDNSGRVVENHAKRVDVKYENGFGRERVHDENGDEKLIWNDVKLGQELNGSVLGGSEKQKIKRRRMNLVIGRVMENYLKGNKMKLNQSRAMKFEEVGTEEGKKQKREKKNKKDTNLEGENAKEKEQIEVDKKLSNSVRSENGGLVGSREIETENKLHAEEVKTEQRKKRKNKNVEEV